MSIKKSFGKGVFLGIFLGMGLVIVPLLLGAYYMKDHPNGKLRQWAENEIRDLSRSLHPFRQIRNYANDIKAVAETPKLKALSKFSFQNVGFAGNRVEKSGDLVTWITPFSDRVPPDETPPESRLKNPGEARPLVLTGLKGEVLSFQLVARSSRDHENLTVEIEHGAGLSKCVTVHRFREIYMKLMVHQGGKYGPLKEIVNPDPLVPFTDPYEPGHVLIHDFSLSADTNQPIWFDVHYSRSCSPGKYHGTLVLRSSGKTVRKTPVTFSVLDATLPRHAGLDRWMEFYTSRFWKGEMIPNDQAYQALFQRYFQVAHQYGFSTNGCGDIGPDIHWDWNTGKPTSVNWSYYDQIFDPILSGKLTGSSPNIWCFPIKTYSLGVGNWGGFMIEGGSPSPIENWKGIPDIAAQNLARLIVQHWKEKGWPLSRGIVYAFDEPSHQLVYYPDIYRLIANVADSIHKGSDNQMRFMLTDNPWPWYKTQAGHHKSVMYDKVDIWAPSSETYIPDRFKKYQEEGKRVWFYQSGPPFIGGSDLASTGTGFRMWFWTAWKYRSNGVYYWAMNFWNGNNRAENPYTNAGSGDGIMFYPGHQLHILGLPDIDGPVPSIRSSQWRRGYEDYKYFTLLKNKGAGDEADQWVNKLVIHALNDGAYIPYWRNPLWWKAGDWDHDPRSWHLARVAMAKKIALLYGKSQ